MLLAWSYCLFVLLSPCMSVYSQALDTSFAPIVNGRIHCTLLQPDHKIVIGGEFTEVNGVQRKYLARLNEDGSLDTQFAPGVDGGSILCLLRQSDGSIVIGGDFTTVAGTSKGRLARVNEAGILDASFSPNPNGTVKAIARHGLDHLLIGGSFSAIGGATQAILARLDNDGVTDQTFAPIISAPPEPPYGETGSGVYSISVRADARILIGGYFTAVNGSTRISLARLLQGGAIDTEFTPNLSNPANSPEPTALVSSVLSMSDDSVLVGGSFDRVNGARRQFHVRLNSSGGLDARNAIDYNHLASWVGSQSVQHDGKIIIGGRGYVFNAGTASRRTLARLNTDGSWDESFDTNLDGKWVNVPSGQQFQAVEVRSIQEQPDGKTLVAGLFYTAKGVAQENIARFFFGPEITQEPLSQVGYAGSNITFTVNASGAGTLSYQWRKNGIDITGATSSTFAIPKLSFADEGDYSVRVANQAGFTISRIAILDVVMPAPAVVVTPAAEQLIAAGGNLTLTATVSSGLSPFTFQWRKDGKPIVKATSSSLVLSNFQAGNAGLYDVVVKNSHGIGLSNRVSLRLPPILNFPDWPGQISRRIGETAVFSVNAANATFQWLKDGVRIKGQTSNTLTVQVNNAAVAGIYSVIITTPSGKITSPPSHLKLLDPSLLIYTLTGSATAIQGTTSTPSPITGFMVVDRLAQRAGMIFDSKVGNVSAHRIEMHEDLIITSTGPLPRSRTVFCEMVNGELSLWFSGADTLVKITTTDATIAPATLKGSINTISGDSSPRIEESTFRLTLDSKNSALSRQTGESLENALLRLSQALQIKGSALIE